MNALSDVKVYSLHVVSETQVTFVIDVREYPQLAEPGVVEQSLNEYLVEYANFHHYDAFILHPGWLFIKATGVLNQSAVNAFTKE